MGSLQKGETVKSYQQKLNSMAVNVERRLIESSSTANYFVRVGYTWKELEEHGRE